MESLIFFIGLIIIYYLMYVKLPQKMNLKSINESCFFSSFVHCKSHENELLRIEEVFRISNANEFKLLNKEMTKKNSQAQLDRLKEEYDRKINEVRCIICLQDFWSYVTIDGNMELHSKDLVVDSNNKCLNKPLNEEEIKVLIY